MSRSDEGAPDAAAERRQLLISKRLGPEFSQQTATFRHHKARLEACEGRMRAAGRVKALLLMLAALCVSWDIFVFGGSLERRFDEQSYERVWYALFNDGRAVSRLSSVEDLAASLYNFCFKAVNADEFAFFDVNLAQARLELVVARGGAETRTRLRLPLKRHFSRAEASAALQLPFELNDREQLKTYFQRVEGVALSLTGVNVCIVNGEVISCIANAVRVSYARNSAVLTAALSVKTEVSHCSSARGPGGWDAKAVLQRFVLLLSAAELLSLGAFLLLGAVARHHRHKARVHQPDEEEAPAAGPGALQLLPWLGSAAQTGSYIAYTSLNVYYGCAFKHHFRLYEAFILSLYFNAAVAVEVGFLESLSARIFLRTLHTLLSFFGNLVSFLLALALTGWIIFSAVPAFPTLRAAAFSLYEVLVGDFLRDFLYQLLRFKLAGALYALVTTVFLLFIFPGIYQTVMTDIYIETATHLNERLAPAAPARGSALARGASWAQSRALAALGAVDLQWVCKEISKLRNMRGVWAEKQQASFERLLYLLGRARAVPRPQRAYLRLNAEYVGGRLGWIADELLGLRTAS